MPGWLCAWLAGWGWLGYGGLAGGLARGMAVWRAWRAGCVGRAGWLAGSCGSLGHGLAVPISSIARKCMNLLPFLTGKRSKRRRFFRAAARVLALA